MYQLNYEFCGVPMELTAAWHIREDPLDTAFRTGEREPAIRVRLEHLPQLPEPRGKFCGVAGEKLVWREGSRVIRRTQDRFRREPHMEVEYDIHDLSHIKVRMRQEDFLWAMRNQYLWVGMALNQLLIYFKTLLFHASYIECGGQGIVFTAPSQTGKSTQAELWRKHRGAQVVNGDKAAISLRKSAMVHSIPFSGTSGICQNVSTPLKAVVVLSQAPVNTVRRMGASEAVAALCGNVFVDQLVQEEWSMALNLLLDLTMSVPVYHLACTPDVRAVEALEKALER